MKPTKNLRNIFILTVSYLYIILFVYASVSKILDFENFRIQLGQSPLLSAFAGFVSWAVLFVEIGIAVMLAAPKFRQAGLLSAFALMTMFTVYIFIILNHSSFIPCSCGGILEKMGWEEHLVFNIVFMVLAAVAGLLQRSRLPENRTACMAAKKVAVFLVVGLFSAAGIILLYLKSEEIVHKRNNFVRRFMTAVVQKKNTKDLTFNSYYFAGAGNGKIYLGNRVAPAKVMVLDSTLSIIDTHTIKLEDTETKFSAIQLKVHPPYFYILDGSVPCVFGGKIADWTGRLKMKGGDYFSLAQIIDSSQFVFRTYSFRSAENVLGKWGLSEGSKKTLHPGLLQKQIDGIFDTDGTLLYNDDSKQIIYQYYYRNQFVVANKNLELLYRKLYIKTVRDHIVKSPNQIYHLKNSEKNLKFHIILSFL